MKASTWKCLLIGVFLVFTMAACGTSSKRSYCDIVDAVTGEKSTPEASQESDAQDAQ